MITSKDILYNLYNKNKKSAIIIAALINSKYLTNIEKHQICRIKLFQKMRYANS